MIQSIPQSKKDDLQQIQVEEGKKFIETFISSTLQWTLYIDLEAFVVFYIFLSFFLHLQERKSMKTWKCGDLNKTIFAKVRELKLPVDYFFVHAIAR